MKSRQIISGDSINPFFWLAYGAYEILERLYYRLRPLEPIALYKVFLERIDLENYIDRLMREKGYTCQKGEVLN